MATTRADIAAALASVPEVTASPSRPATVAPYCAWPEWVSNRPQTAGCEVCDVQWNVWVTLPGGTSETAIEAGDALNRRIGSALNAIGAVTLYGPAQLAGDDNTPIPVIRYELHCN